MLYPAPYGGYDEIADSWAINLSFYTLDIVLGGVAFFWDCSMILKGYPRMKRFTRREFIRYYETIVCDLGFLDVSSKNNH